MRVRYANNDLEQCAQSIGAATRKWGPEIAKKYIQAIGVLAALERLDDLFKIGHYEFHPLGADRKGEYAMTLKRRCRVIVERSDDGAVIVKEVTVRHYER